MINFFQRKILFLSNHQMSFGDGLSCIKRFNSYLESTDIVHYCLNPVTLECLYWALVSKNVQCDRIVSAINRFPYDVVVLENYYGEFDNHKILKKVGSAKLMRGVSCNYDLEMFGKPPIKEKKERRIKDILNIGKEKKLCLFPFSTRPLASISIDGIKKLAEFYKDYTIYLCGEFFDPYSTDSFMSKELARINELNDVENIVNVLGLGTLHYINLCHNVDLVVCAPSGIVLLPTLSLIKQKLIVIEGGDSEIMYSIYQGHKDKSTEIDFIRTTCPLYPCGGKKDEKAVSCRENRHALCLNSEMKIQ